MGYMLRTANLLGAVALGVHDRMADVTQAEAGRSGVTAAALATLHQYPGVTVEALRRCLGISQPATVRTVDALQARELLVRKPGNDRRSVALHLTGAGDSEAQRVLAARADVLTVLLDGVDGRDRAVLDRVLEHILSRLTTDPQRGDEICRLCDIPTCPQERCPVECAAQTWQAQQRDARC